MARGPLDDAAACYVSRETSTADLNVATKWVPVRSNGVIAVASGVRANLRAFLLSQPGVFHVEHRRLTTHHALVCQPFVLESPLCELSTIKRSSVGLNGRVCVYARWLHVKRCWLVEEHIRPEAGDTVPSPAPEHRNSWERSTPAFHVKRSEKHAYLGAFYTPTSHTVATS